MQGQGVLGMLRRLWQRLEQLDPGGEVADGFQIGRAVTGLLARPLPVANRLLVQPSLGVVLGDQLGLRLDGLRETGPPTPGQCADGTAGGCSAARTDRPLPGSGRV